MSAIQSRLCRTYLSSPNAVAFSYVSSVPNRAGQSRYYTLCPAVPRGVSLSRFARIRAHACAYPTYVCCMYTTLLRLSLISPLTLWPKIPTLDTAKIPLDGQRGPKGNVSTRLNGVATESIQAERARPLLFVNRVA